MLVVSLEQGCFSKRDCCGLSAAVFLVLAARPKFGGQEKPSPENSLIRTDESLEGRRELSRLSQSVSQSVICQAASGHVRTDTPHDARQTDCVQVWRFRDGCLKIEKPCS